MGNAILGVLMGLLGFIGLVMASQARDDAIYVAGLIVFLFGVLFVFAMIKRAFDGTDAKQSDET